MGQQERTSGVQEKQGTSKTIEVGRLLHNTPDNFIGGKISSFTPQWEIITSDRYILDIIQFGYKIEFSSMPCIDCNRKEIKFSGKEHNVINELLKKLTIKGVIEKVSPEPDQILSNIFIRPKSDGSYRLILNLSHLNDHIDKKHFKMETLRSALQLVKKNCFFAKLDFKDAYYSISIKESDRKFLRFIWNGNTYQFTCLPNGLSSAPRIFTKVMKPVFSTLRHEGHTNCAYIDDALLSGDTFQNCSENVDRTTTLVDGLGLTVHPNKSIFVPSQCIEFVGFMIDSVKMTVVLTERKTQDIIKQCSFILQTYSVTIREFAKLIGKLVSCEPGVQYAPLYYKSLERVHC